MTRHAERVRLRRRNTKNATRIPRSLSTGGAKRQSQAVSGQCPALLRLGRVRLHPDKPSTRNVGEASDPRQWDAGSDKLVRGEHLEPGGGGPRKSKGPSPLVLR